MQLEVSEQQALLVDPAVTLVVVSQELARQGSKYARAVADAIVPFHQHERISARVQQLRHGRVFSQPEDIRDERQWQLGGRALPLVHVGEWRQRATTVCDEGRERSSDERWDVRDTSFEGELASFRLAEPTQHQIPEAELARCGTLSDLQFLLAEQVEDLEPLVEMDAIHTKHAEPAILEAFNECQNFWMQLH